MPEGMQRIALGIEYSGAVFNGFQRQASTRNTVQAHLEEALSEIAQEDITLVCAGRTDAGVHATGQVLHFDTLSSRPRKAWVLGVNTKLPEAIRVNWSLPVVAGFHARFSALYRTYRYIFHVSPVRSSIVGRQITHSSYPLNLDAMKQASGCLIGRHDFSAFRSSQCQAKNPEREVLSIEWFEQGELIVMQIKANAFLHHMVRNIVGSLLEIGKGQQDTSWLAEVLSCRDRTLAGPTAAPWGLYLVDVGYKLEFNLPREKPGPIFLAN